MAKHAEATAVAEHSDTALPESAALNNISNNSTTIDSQIEHAEMSTVSKENIQNRTTQPVAPEETVGTPEQTHSIPDTVEHSEPMDVDQKLSTDASPPPENSVVSAPSSEQAIVGSPEKTETEDKTVDINVAPLECPQPATDSTEPPPPAVTEPAAPPTVESTDSTVINTQVGF